ncbi:MAG: TrmH family RNA methyltransferase [Bacteroidota bacterium]
MKEQIVSLQNPLIKQLVRLQQKASERAKTGLFIAEGRREVSLALSGRIKPHNLLICQDIYQEDPSYPIDALLSDQTDPTMISRAVYNKLAYRKDVEGVLLVGEQRDHSLSSLILPPDPLLIILEGVEKPGNLGAILRTADGAGVDGLILADEKAGIYNPNTIRASLGCVFTLPVAACSSETAITWLTRADNWQPGQRPTIYTAALQTEQNYYEADFRGATALAFGAEDKGLSAVWREASDKVIRIPMAGHIDSLNVSASVAILAFEAVRQRQQQKGRK